MQAAVLPLIARGIRILLFLDDWLYVSHQRVCPLGHIHSSCIYHGDRSHSELKKCSLATKQSAQFIS